MKIDYLAEVEIDSKVNSEDWNIELEQMVDVAVDVRLSEGAVVAVAVAVEV